MPWEEGLVAGFSFLGSRGVSLIMKRILSLTLICFLSLAAGWTPAVGAQSQDPGSSQGDCLAGRAAGLWNLPRGDERGLVRGLLTTQESDRKLALEGILRPALPGPGDLRTGRLDGRLFPVLASGPADQPVAEIHGTYLVGPDGKGRFEAWIVRLRDQQRIGRISGIFEDPAGRPDADGRFLGRGVICR
jgi:hypothetical protein